MDDNIGGGPEIAEVRVHGLCVQVESQIDDFGLSCRSLLRTGALGGGTWEDLHALFD